MRKELCSTLTAALLLASMATPGGPVVAQETTEPAAAEPSFSTDQLEQLVAPIALYPDALLMQILMAATYPLEIVEAARWLGKNPDLTGTALDEGLKEEDWDPSVKSLCTLPDLLGRMSDNLDWTQDLGDAFLEQKDNLLDTVQRMRGKAYDAGNLETSEQQVVTVEKEKIIVIESPSPEIVYVPTYSPTVVYGAWAPPVYYYPPMYPPYPPGAGLITFGVGVAVGAAIWGDCHWGWGHHNVNVNVNHYNNFNRNTNINHNTNINRGGGGQASWQHDPSHRGGVNYKNQNVASKYGAQGGSNRVSSQQARGWSGTTGANRSGAGATTRPQGTGAGSPSGTRPQGTGAGSPSGTRPQGTGAGSPSGTRSQGKGAASASGTRPSSSAYSGARSPSLDRAASSRGSMSRGMSSYGGGGARSGRTRSGGRR